jgi:uncharacterized protein YyaL (SSP411 family)
VRPATDDKVLAAWNGMAIAACAAGHQVLGDARYLDAAQRGAAFVLAELADGGRLRRSWHAGRARQPAFLEDYAFVADALLSLFETDFDPRWLEAARDLLATVRARFRDPQDGTLYFTADDHEELIARSSSVAESSMPSGAAVAARAFLRAGLLLADPQLHRAGLDVLQRNGALLQQSPVVAPALVLALLFERADAPEVVIAGEPADPRTRALLARVRAAFPPHRVVALVHDGNRGQLEALSPVFAGKVPAAAADGGSVPAAYVCFAGVCTAPVTDPERLLR